mgnify:CR=1 FL=1
MGGKGLLPLAAALLAVAVMAGCTEDERNRAPILNEQQTQAMETGRTETSPEPTVPGPETDPDETDSAPTRPNRTAPEKLDELPDRRAVLYQFRDEDGNPAGLLLEIGGRREEIWPAGVRWAYLDEADADGDGTREIVVTFSAGGGTGANDGRVGVFRRDFASIPLDDPVVALKSAMAMSMDHDRREIVLETNGRSWRIPFPDDETDWWPEPHVGNVVTYAVRDDRLYASVGLQASNVWFPADCWLAYDWNGERLAATVPEVHVHKETGHPYRFEDHRLGLSVRVPAGWFVDTGAFGGEATGGERFAVLVDGHPERVLRHDDHDRITVTAGTGPAPKNREHAKLKGEGERVDVELPSGEKAVLHVAAAGETVELWFLSDIAVASGALQADTFNRHRDAIVQMLGSLETLPRDTPPMP